MSRITDYILEPKVVYTEGGFLVRVKVIDDYKYKKYIVSENLHYKTVQGTSFTLTDADTTKQAEITEMLGDTIQEGTPTPSNPIEVKTVSGDNNIVVSNKNKLALDKVEKGRIDNGNVGYRDNTTNLEVTNTDITFTTNANYRGVVSDFMPIEIMQTINNYVYLLMGNKKAFLTNGAIQISFYDENKNYISSNSGYALNDTTQRYIITNNMKYARIWFCLNQQGTITLEKVSFGYYTEYTEHQGNSYKVDLGGKNLFNDILRQGVTIYNTGVWGPSNSRLTSTDWIKNVKAGTYTISAKTSTAKALQVSMITFNTSGVFNNVSGVSGQWKTMPFTFTIPIDMQLKCNISYTDNSNITPSEVTEVQLENGTVATEYSPFNPIELCKIGNYQDKLYYEGGKWYIEKNIEKVVLNGSENWGLFFSTNGVFISSSTIISINSASTINCISNYYANTYSRAYIRNNLATVDNACATTNNELIIANKSITSVADFKTWLQNNNVTVYYVLATPTTEEITDSYLLEQLNGLLDIELYEDLCYVDWVGTLAGIMTLQYAGTEDLGIKYIITEDGKKIRTDWRKLGRRKKWMMK